MPFDPSALLHGFDSDKLDALVDTMVLAADADGEIGDAERDSMIASVRSYAEGSTQDDDLTKERIGELLDKAKKHIAEGGRDALIASVKARLDKADARRGALGLAISVSAADGIVRTSERELIMDLAEALEVDRDEAADMVRDITRP
jgi:tellurite resistance protein